jgi:hypothetical protein
MLSIVIGPGRYGDNTHLSWTDGEPVPTALHDMPDDSVVQFIASGPELELFIHAMNADDEYLRRVNGPVAANPLPAAAGDPASVALAFVIVGMLAGSTPTDPTAVAKARELSRAMVQELKP